jgi:hypothetical protein
MEIKNEIYYLYTSIFEKEKQREKERERKKYMYMNYSFC